MSPDAETRAAMVEAMRQHGPNAKKLTAAILAAEARGWKLVKPDATEEMLVAMEAAPCGDPDGGETGAFWGPMWTDAHAAAPGWGGWDMTNATDERRARAIAGAMWHADDQPAWEEFSESKKIESLAQARAIRASDAEAGMVLVPRVATEKMLRAGWDEIDWVNPGNSECHWHENRDGSGSMKTDVADAWRAIIAAHEGDG